MTHGNFCRGVHGRCLVDVLPLPNSTVQLITPYSRPCLSVGVIVENGKIVSQSLTHSCDAAIRVSTRAVRTGQGCPNAMLHSPGEQSKLKANGLQLLDDAAASICSSSHLSPAFSSWAAAC